MIMNKFNAFQFITLWQNVHIPLAKEN